ncbi:MAG: hypothetical protein MJ072_01825, partial [Clostridia bacterium]|nr:hypothetical protein [Clostridia bacterium]
NGDTWYPKRLNHVDLLIDRAAMTAKYGDNSKDSARLHIKYTKGENGLYIGNYEYLLPKEWESIPEDAIPKYITLKSGQYFDFFMDGEYLVTTPINDSDYKDGFYNFIVKNFDNVFAIPSVSSP